MGRIVSGVVLVLGLSFAGGCMTAPEREKVTAPQEGLAASAETATPREAELVCPESRTKVECKALPPFHGLSPRHPGEWGADKTFIRRLSCADGGSPYLIREPSPGRRDPRAGEQEDDERIHRWTAVCNSKTYTVFVRENGCGNPCPPQGFRLIPFEAYEAIESTWAMPLRRDKEATLAAVEKARELAPDIERIYTDGYYRLMELKLHERALQLVEEGLKRIPSSRTLAKMRIEARAALENEQAESPAELKGTRVRYSRDPSDTAEDRCEGLPENFGLSELFPIEVGSIMPMARLVCSDGTTPMHERQGNLGGFKGTTTSPAGGMSFGKEPADIIDSYTVQCPSRAFTVYFNKYRSGRPCAPPGLRFIPEEAFGALVQAWKHKREGDLATAIGEAEKARVAAPDVERVYLELLDLMSRGHDIPAALTVVSEGVKSVPDSANLRLNLAGLLMRFEQAEEAEKEIDALLARLKVAGDQRLLPASLCTKASIAHALGKTEEVAKYRKEACEWGYERCCIAEEAAADSGGR